MSELPSGWSLAPIDAVTSKPQQRVPEASETFSYIDISSVSREEKKITQPQKIAGREAPSRARQIVRAGDVLVSMTRPNLNAVALVPHELDGQIASTGFDVLRPLEVEPRWIFAAVRTESFVKEMSNLVQGALYPAVRPRDIRGYEISIPPLAEQKRIASKLDALLARVGAARARLDRIPTLLKRFRQSVLAAATSGQLTEDWRQEQSAKASVQSVGPVHHGTDNDLPPPKAQVGSSHHVESTDSVLQILEEFSEVEVREPFFHTVKAPACWRFLKLDDVCDFIGGSQPPKSTFVTEESGDVIRLIQIRDYKSDKHKVYIPRSLARRFCSKTDIMIGRYGPPIFQILRGLEGAYNVALMKAQPKIEAVWGDYLFYWLKNDALLKYVEAGSDRTAGQDGVRKELLYSYPFFLPSLDEQKEIVRRIESLFALADRIEDRYNAARDKTEKLTPALLAKAFRGELVPQNPNDEPADQLLARIRASAPEKARPKKSSKKTESA